MVIFLACLILMVSQANSGAVEYWIFKYPNKIYDNGHNTPTFRHRIDNHIFYDCSWLNNNSFSRFAGSQICTFVSVKKYKLA